MKSLFKLAVPLFAAAILAGCTTAQTLDKVANAEDPIAAALEIAPADAHAAFLLAQASGDEKGIACWPAVEAWLTDLQKYHTQATETEGSGVLAAYQRARNLRISVQDKVVPEKVQIACAAMVNDSVGVVNKILKIVGGAAIPGIPLL